MLRIGGTGVRLMVGKSSGSHFRMIDMTLVLAMLAWGGVNI